MWTISFHHMTLLTLCWAVCCAHWKVCPGAWNNLKKIRHALATNSVHDDSAGQLKMLEVRTDYRWLNCRVYEHNLVKRNQKVLVQADGQGGLACCGPCGHKDSDMTERLNWTDLSRLHTANVRIKQSEGRRVGFPGDSLRAACQPLRRRLM